MWVVDLLFPLHKTNLQSLTRLGMIIRSTFRRILVFSAVSKSLLFELKMSGSADAACFSADGRYLYTEGDEKEIYQWDLNTHKLFARILDEGCVKATALALSANGGMLASGCSSGVVNVYKTEGPSHKLAAEHPVKVFRKYESSVEPHQFDDSGDEYLHEWQFRAYGNSVEVEKECAEIGASAVTDHILELSGHQEQFEVRHRPQLQVSSSIQL
jgi:hypothetical protein